MERGEQLTDQSIHYMLTLVEEGNEGELETLFKDVICITARGKPLRPKPWDKKYVDAMRQKTITVGIGPAGTGKTYLAVAWRYAPSGRRRSTGSSSPALRWKPEKSWAFAGRFAK